MGDQDLQLVFKSLVLDQLIVPTVQPQTGEVFYCSGRWPPFDDFENVPCISCPHFETCQIEDVDRFDALMLRQPLTQAEKYRDDLMLKKHGNSSSSFGTLQIENELTSKINPSTCPYFSQWLGVMCDPIVAKPNQESIR